MAITTNALQLSPALTGASKIPLGAINAERLVDTYRSGSTAYVHPEDGKLPDQYKVDRGMEQYFADIPGLKEALSREGIGTYLDVGAGYGKAAEEIARHNPGLRVIAVSNSDFSEGRQLPANMTYLVGNASDAIEDRGVKPDVMSDMYGEFTFDVFNQADLISSHMERLAPRGRSFIRFDGDHIGVVNQQGTLMLFSEWINDLDLRNVQAVTAPNPTGPTALVSVITLLNNVRGFGMPRLDLLGIKQFANDIVPFVVYGINED